MSRTRKDRGKNRKPEVWSKRADSTMTCSESNRYCKKITAKYERQSDKNLCREGTEETYADQWPQSRIHHLYVQEHIVMVSMEIWDAYADCLPDEMG